MTSRQKITIILMATLSTLALIGIYFGAVTAISGFKFTLSQFKMYWYFLIGLALGFGVQVGLYMYLRELVKNSPMNMRGTVAVTGSTSTLAMISCCAHYLVNVVPILGIAGAVAIIAQYQIEIFWVGLAFNLFGVAFITRRIIQFNKHLS